MYPNDLAVAETILSFALLGIAYGLLYEIVRFFRLLVPAGKIRTGIEDTVLIVLLSAVTFIIVILMNGNQLRLYHVLGVLAGFFAYILTLGRLIYFINIRICGFVRRVFSIVLHPLNILAMRIKQKSISIVRHIYKMLTNIIKKTTYHLKSREDIVYNNNTHKNILQRGEPRSVIKAKIK